MPSWLNMPIHSLSATARGSSTAMVLFFRYLNRHSKIGALAIEPLPPDSPLWDAPNALISPHVSAESVQKPSSRKICVAM